MENPDRPGHHPCPHTTATPPEQTIHKHKHTQNVNRWIQAKRIDPELKARAVRLVVEHQQEYPSMNAAAVAVAKKLGLGHETVRRWVVQSEVDAGDRAGRTSEELAEIKALKARVRRLEEDNAILKAATTFFAGELDPRNR